MKLRRVNSVTRLNEIKDNEKKARRDRIDQPYGHYRSLTTIYNSDYRCFAEFMNQRILCSVLRVVTPITEAYSICVSFYW